MNSEEKKKKRKENRKRKVAAYLSVAELNDAEKKAKVLKKEESDSIDKNENIREDDIAESRKLVTKYSSNSCTEVADKPHLEGEEYEELRRRLRARKKSLASIPLFRLKAVGHDASLAVSKRIPLFMSDIQHLLLYCMVGDRAPYKPYRWCLMEKWNRLSNMVVLVVEGLGLEDYTTHHSQFSWLRRQVPDLVEVMSPASYQSSVVEELTLLPLSGTHMTKLIQEFGTLENACEKEEAVKALRPIFNIKHTNTKMSDAVKLKLLLSPAQMMMERYPLPTTDPSGKKYEKFVFSQAEYREVSEESPVFSVDCEMCLTDEGNELTRVAVLDSKLKVVYHTLVKPRNKIR